MIYRLETITRKVRRFFSRDRFLVWLFGMPEKANHSSDHGIILLQIDGLSLPELQKALANGSMPFIQKILDKEHYAMHSLYAGIPSSTPAAQGELFYGIKGCVPAFCFKRCIDTYPKMMLEPSLAKHIQSRLEKQGDPLMREGSVFTDIFTGGAKEASFCVASTGWSSLIPSKNFFKMMIFAILNSISLIKVTSLTLCELFLAIIDVFRGVFSGQNVYQELKFVPVRLATAVLLRELSTIGIKLDAARGVPIIHGNFLSYDEQSHRRGPSSRFAHWGLKGIDKSIKQIWKAARRSEYKDYDIWIYSDHGHEKTRSYNNDFGESIQTAVNRVLLGYIESPNIKDGNVHLEVVDDPNLQHLHLLNYPRINKWLKKRGNRQQEEEERHVHFSLAAMGPLGFIYLDESLGLEGCVRCEIANDLVTKANIPMVLSLSADEDTDKHKVSVWTQKGQFYLPQHKALVFGHDHPFLDEVCSDIMSLCQHEYAGQFILSGWTHDNAPMSLRVENGAHGGPGQQETHAFALLPEDFPMSPLKRGYLRFLDLHNVAKQQIYPQQAQNEHETASTVLSNSNKAKNTLRVMTYNIHSCMGMDDRLSPKRIARIIAMNQPDVVALQEILIDQVDFLADSLGMQSHFFPTKKAGSSCFGNAILSKHPLKLLNKKTLSPDFSRFTPNIAPLTQSRGMLEVEINYNGNKFTMINTHLGLTTKDRRAQVLDILSSPSFEDGDTPAIFCGDFNASPRQQAHHKVNSVMTDVDDLTNHHVVKKTFPSRYPVLRLDHIFVNRQVKVNNVLVPSNHLTKVASDHLPVIADLDIQALFAGQ